MDSGIWIALIGGGATFLTPLLVRLFTRDHRKDLDIEIDILNKLKADEDESLKVPAQEFQKLVSQNVKDFVQEEPIRKLYAIAFQRYFAFLFFLGLAFLANRFLMSSIDPSAYRWLFPRGESSFWSVVAVLLELLTLVAFVCAVWPLLCALKRSLRSLRVVKICPKRGNSLEIDRE